MKKIVKAPSGRRPVSAEAIARMADSGKDISGFFGGGGRMARPGELAGSSAGSQSIQRVNLDLTAAMLQELDQAAESLNISRQAAIKTLVRQALDQHYLARRARQD